MTITCKVISSHFNLCLCIAASLISAAVHEILLPIMKEIKNDFNSLKDDLNSMKNDLSSLNKTVSNLSGDLEDYKQQTTSELAGLTYELAGLQSNVTSELAGLQSNMTSELAGLTSELAGLHTSLQSNTTEQLTQLCEKVNMLRDDTSSLKGDLSSLNDSMNRISDNVEAHDNHVTTELAGLQSNMTSELAGLQSNVTSELAGLQSNVTSELAGLRSDVESQLATIENITSDLHNSLQSNTQQLAQLCAKMDTLYSKLISQCTPVPLSSTPTPHTTPTSLPPSPTSLPPSPTSLPPSPTSLPPSPTSLLPSPLFSCGGTGGWRRVVYLNMTDPNTTCPSGWQLTNLSRRICGRVNESDLSCDSVTFPVSGGDYTRVCGRIIAYQYRQPSAFGGYNDGYVTTIDGPYADGVILTHGSPRQHIWTFVGGWTEYPTEWYICPCDANYNVSAPPFVDGDYFCESGRHAWRDFNQFFPDDPLWDGDGCTANSTCCSFNNPPYFTKQLPSPTTDDVEARLCHRFDYDDTPIEFMELYVQ